jgi:hypothetical protein
VDSGAEDVVFFALNTDDPFVYGESDAFTIFNPEDVTLVSIDPEWKYRGEAEFELELTGSSFVSSSVVLFNGEVDGLLGSREFVADLPSPFTATRYHSLIVERKSLPDVLEITAITKDPRGDIVMVSSEIIADELVRLDDERLRALKDVEEARKRRNEIADAMKSASAEERPTMIEEGDRVRVVPREKSPTSLNYAGQRGIVTMTTPSVYGPLFFVHIDGNPGGVETGFSEEDLLEVQEWEED